MVARSATNRVGISFRARRSVPSRSMVRSSLSFQSFLFEADPVRRVAHGLLVSSPHAPRLPLLASPRYRQSVYASAACAVVGRNHLRKGNALANMAQ
jgi:hypothetical protein